MQKEKKILCNITAQRYSRGPGDVAGEVEGRENDEKRLLRFLVNGYERDVRPVRNATTPVVIKLGITLTQIFDMVSLVFIFFFNEYIIQWNCVELKTNSITNSSVG